MKPEVANEIIPWFHVGDGVFRFLCADTLRVGQICGRTRTSESERSPSHRALPPLPRAGFRECPCWNAIPITDSLIRRWSPYLRVCEPICPLPPEDLVLEMERVQFRDVPDYPQSMEWPFKDLAGDSGQSPGIESSGSFAKQAFAIKIQGQSQRMA